MNGLLMGLWKAWSTNKNNLKITRYTGGLGEALGGAVWEGGRSDRQTDAWSDREGEGGGRREKKERDATGGVFGAASDHLPGVAGAVVVDEPVHQPVPLYLLSDPPPQALLLRSHPRRQP